MCQKYKNGGEEEIKKEKRRGNLAGIVHNADTTAVGNFTDSAHGESDTEFNEKLRKKKNKREGGEEKKKKSLTLSFG